MMEGTPRADQFLMSAFELRYYPHVTQQQAGNPAVVNPPASSAPGTVLVFLKYPEPGRVKTRLAATVGPDRAASLYREMIDTVFALLQPIRPRARVIGYFDGAPESAFAEWHMLADAWWAQPAGDLGTRLDVGFRTGATEGGPVLAVGTDCLDIEATLLDEALDVLVTRDAVFGPAHDGGYYLVGTSRYIDGFFADVPWSSDNTLAEHLNLCCRRGLSFGLLPPLHDIDTHDDWLAHRERKGFSDGGP
jgi:rSAM/selenodomain-associated transferase 1